MSVNWKLTSFDALSSTQDYLKTHHTQYQEGQVVLAQKQSSGMGRKGRSWSSPKGGLYFSLLLRPSKLPQNLPFFVLYSLLKTLEKHSSNSLEVKYPNDILYDNQKLAGCLIDAAHQGNTLLYTVIGIGINLTQARLPEQACSLQSITSLSLSPKSILSDFLEDFGSLYPRLEQCIANEYEALFLECFQGRNWRISYNNKITLSAKEAWHYESR